MNSSFDASEDSYPKIGSRRVYQNKINSRQKSSLGFLDLFEKTKTYFLVRMYWGRTNFYRNMIHGIVIVITLTIVFSGFYIQAASAVKKSNISANLGNSIGTEDILEQGGSVQSVLVQDLSGPPVQTFTHKVESGETLDSIAEKYNVKADTIKWASLDGHSELLFGDQIKEGWELKIPEIDGVVHKVQSGDTIDYIVNRYAQDNAEVNEFTISELNRIKDDEDLKAGMYIFIPGGNIKTQEIGDLTIPEGAFIDPLSHPSCKGYNFSRGFLSYHNGVDLAKWNGCSISAVADGFVEYAGWADGGQGYMVRIKHPGGIKTEYFHGKGTYYVKAGDVVRQGDLIMEMGSTGNSTGTHLHFILWKDGIAINPRPYVPYRGAY